MAYGVNAPFGLQPRYMLNGATWNNQTSEYSIASGYATSLFTGDPVTMLNTGGIGIAVGGAAGSQGATLGVFWGCAYTLNGVYITAPFWSAGTVPDNAQNATAFIVDDPNTVFDIQVASTSSAAHPTIAYANIGLNANFAVGGAGNPASGSTVSGLSAYYLAFESLSPGTSATLNLKLLRFTPNPNNQPDSPSQPDPATKQDFNNALVVINNHILKGGTGTAGI
jgi:hypothetical protein